MMGRSVERRPEAGRFYCGRGDFSHRYKTGKRAKAACEGFGNSDDEPLGGDGLEQGCLDRRKAHFERSDGINKIVSARCQRPGEQWICDV